MRFRIPTLEDVTTLSELETALNRDGQPTPGMRDMLQWCTEHRNSCAHGSIARTVVSEEEITGFLSATLVANNSAGLLEQALSPTTILEPKYYRPLDDNELKRANRAYGSALYITSCFWRKFGDSEQDIAFVEEASDHIVRWFEGNTIGSVMIVVEDGLLEFAEVVKRSISPDCFVEKSTGSASTFISVKAPFARIGPSVDWLRRLLSNPDRPQRGIPDDLKLSARILHEYDFDIREALQSGVHPTWDWSEPPLGEKWSVQKSAPGHAVWRREVRKHLGLKVASSSKDPNLMRKIKAVLAAEPALMAL